MAPLTYLDAEERELIECARRSEIEHFAGRFLTHPRQ